MQNRIDRLEGLVLSLMTNGAQSAGPAAAAAAISRSQSDAHSAGSTSYPPEQDQDDDMIKEEEELGEDSDVDGVTNSLGVLKVDADKGKSLYFGDSHWHLVLADVSIQAFRTRAHGNFEGASSVWNDENLQCSTKINSEVFESTILSLYPA